jgi:hypothetical protein
VIPFFSVSTYRATWVGAGVVVGLAIGLIFYASPAVPQPVADVGPGRSDTPTPAPPERKHKTSQPRHDILRPPTGAEILLDFEEGDAGDLSVVNHTPEDAAVKLVDRTTDRAARFFYVRSGTTGSAGNIPAGQYRLMYCSGSDWDLDGDIFRELRSCAEFDRLLVFEAAGRAVYTVTLHTVVGGNARTTQLSKEAFRTAGAAP